MRLIYHESCARYHRTQPLAKPGGVCEECEEAMTHKCPECGTTMGTFRRRQDMCGRCIDDPICVAPNCRLRRSNHIGVRHPFVEKGGPFDKPPVYRKSLEERVAVLENAVLEMAKGIKELADAVAGLDPPSAAEFKELMVEMAGMGKRDPADVKAEIDKLLDEGRPVTIDGGDDEP